MFRSTTSVLALLAAMTVPAVAADYGDWGDEADSGPDFRTSYPVEPGDWAGLGDDDDPISLEFGIRYWYSMGQQELHVRRRHRKLHRHLAHSANCIFVSKIIRPTPMPRQSRAMPSVDQRHRTPRRAVRFRSSTARSCYGGADFGWHAWGDNNGSGIGPMVGYLYWKDQPDTGRFNYTTATSAADITYDPRNGPDLPARRQRRRTRSTLTPCALASPGKAKLGDMFDITATIAGVPYAKVGGTAGIDDPTFSITEYAGPSQPPYDLTNNGNISSMRSSPTAIDGWGYGAMADAFVGFHPTENLTFRLGGRAWYLQGTADATYGRAVIGNADRQRRRRRLRHRPNVRQRRTSSRPTIRSDVPLRPACRGNLRVLIPVRSQTARRLPSRG